MNRAMLLEHLKATERHIAQNREHVADQRELIAHLENDSHQAAAEKAALLLKLLLDTLALHQLDRDRIQHELAKNGQQPALIKPAASDGLTAEHCYARDEECRAKADRTCSNEARQLWLLAARSWSFLADRAALDKRSQAEDARWEKQREKLERALHRASD